MEEGHGKNEAAEGKTVRNDPVSGSQPILCINSGSSSLKFALHKLESGKETLMAEGSVLSASYRPMRI
jgi:hypothetical protein